MTDEAEMIDRSAIARQLTAWVVELVPGCDESEISEEASLRQFAGFDSIAIVQLLARAEDEFGVDLADQDETIRSVDSVGLLAESIIRLGGRPQ
ncbi:acyl carrier protein [Streptomyces sp. SBT349]|uniref:acyl carrier protein n=1 Tax=Streptomyces sp. SBT349 TaxID=1580539 RepID=UPI00066AFA1F|nr:phosphopantetheine-binding protein [Streptomyces sp. SBT349]